MEHPIGYASAEFHLYWGFHPAGPRCYGRAGVLFPLYHEAGGVWLRSCRGTPGLETGAPRACPKAIHALTCTTPSPAPSSAARCRWGQAVMAQPMKVPNPAPWADIKLGPIAVWYPSLYMPVLAQFMQGLVPICIGPSPLPSCSSAPATGRLKKARTPRIRECSVRHSHP